MTTTISPSSAPNTNNPSSRAPSVAITPEVVQKVTEKVYGLLVADLKIERERRTFSSHKPSSSGGGH